MINYYEILEIDESATFDEIKKAYKKLAIIHHPDKGGNQNRFQEISQAYEILSNEEKKQEYDNLKKYDNYQNIINFNFKDPNKLFNEFFNDFSHLNINNGTNPFETSSFNSLFQNFRSFNNNSFISSEILFNDSKKIEKIIEIQNGLKTEKIIETDLNTGKKTIKQNSKLLF